ncbi:MAG TPA: sulfotransferase [Bacteroidales bacterium]|nr:sulfotransferase [Bacteroidales bacterium]
MERPIIISGLRKSGTSLVKSLLDNHPDLFVFPPNELHFFRYSAHPSLVKDKLARMEKNDELFHALAMSSFIRRMGDKRSEYYQPEFDPHTFNELIRSGQPKDHRDVYNLLFEAMYASLYGETLPQGVRCVSKTVLETEFFPEWLSMYPDCRFVYVLRNPYAHFVSAVRSLRTHTGRNNRRKNRSTYEGMPLHAIDDPYPFLGPELGRMRHSYYFMEKYARLYPDHFHILVYDELIRSPEHEMKKLCGFLDIRYDPHLLEPTLLGRPWKGNSWHSPELDGIDTRPLNEWKKHISGGEVRLLNRYFRGLIDRHFELQLPYSSLLWPFHASEYKPWVYLGNRFLYYSSPDIC